MCGRFSLDYFPTTIVKALVDAEIAFQPREQVYPTNEVAVAIRTDNGNELAQMKWGWERSFSKRPLINARSAEACNVTYLLSAIRHIFGHGHLSPTSNQADSVISICKTLCAFHMGVMNHDFSIYIDDFELMMDSNEF